MMLQSVCNGNGAATYRAVLLVLLVMLSVLYRLWPTDPPPSASQRGMSYGGSSPNAINPVVAIDWLRNRPLTLTVQRQPMKWSSSYNQAIGADVTINAAKKLLPYWHWVLFHEHIKLRYYKNIVTLYQLHSWNKNFAQCILTLPNL